MSKRNIVTIAGTKIDLDHVTGFSPVFGDSAFQGCVFTTGGQIHVAANRGGNSLFKDQYEAAIKKWEEG